MTAEFEPALLLAVIALCSAAYCAWLYTRFEKPYYAWWSASWILYAVRVGVIIGFLRSGNSAWLFWHQVLTGWSALGFFAASMSFSRGLVWRPWMAGVALFPVVWSYIAIFTLDSFTLAVVPAIIFLSSATLGTGVGFLNHARRTGSPGAWALAGAFTLWAVHHLDYPLLRARGAWVPWGYYLDILFILAVVGGIALLVIDDLRRGVEALARLSSDMQAGPGGDAVVAALLERPLRLRGVSGTALYHVATSTVLDGAGKAAGWRGTGLPAAVAPVVTQALRDDRSASAALAARSSGERFVAALPVYGEGVVTHVLVLLGDVRDPFTALDEEFLRALGRQVGSALQQAELTMQLEARTEELARLSTRLVEQHEDERKRLARELHDETGQLFSAMRMEVGALQAVAGAGDVAARMDALVTAGLSSLRRVTAALRPSHCWTTSGCSAPFAPSSRRSRMKARWWRRCTRRTRCRRCHATGNWRSFARYRRASPTPCATPVQIESTCHFPCRTTCCSSRWTTMAWVRRRGRNSRCANAEDMWDSSGCASGSCRWVARCGWKPRPSAARGSPSRWAFPSAPRRRLGRWPQGSHEHVARVARDRGG